MASNDVSLDDDAILDVTGTGHSRSYYYDFLGRRLSRLENQMAAYRARVSCLEKRFNPETLQELAERRRTKFDYIVVGEKDEIESRISYLEHLMTNIRERVSLLEHRIRNVIFELLFALERRVAYLESQLKIARQQPLTMQQLYERRQEKLD